MVGDSSRTYYEVLGVGRNASLDEIRAAHRHLAQMLHPDHHAFDSEVERNLAERRMREVNEAWTVLSHSEHRAEYDYLLEQHQPAASPPGPQQSHESRPVEYDAPDLSHGYHGTYMDHEGHRVDAMFFDAGDDDDDETGRRMPGFLRPVPVAVMLVVALAIFVFTAYAASGRDDGARTPSTKVAKDCVLVQADGNSVMRVACSGPNDGRIVGDADASGQCASGTSPVVVQAKTVCIDPQVSVLGSTVGD